MMNDIETLAGAGDLVILMRVSPELAREEGLGDLDDPASEAAQLLGYASHAEVSLVAILDADKEGFLRSNRSLTQTAGRAARNVNGKVILYADTVTGSMKRMMDETNRRRSACIRCATCDGHPCLVNAKADAQVCCVDPALAHPNVTLVTGAYVERLRQAYPALDVVAVSQDDEGATRLWAGENGLESSTVALDSK